MSFLESPQFPECPSLGYTSEPAYSNTITRFWGGGETRQRNWSRPLIRISCTVGPREDEVIETLLAWWHVAGGSANGFRFKDYADFSSATFGSAISAVDQPLILDPGSPALYQLTKRYTHGAGTQDREIYKPVSGTVLIADNGVLKTAGVHYTIDHTTGLVSLLFTPVGALTWGGEFDLPMRFDSEMPVEVMERRIQSVSFSLMELRKNADGTF